MLFYSFSPQATLKHSLYVVRHSFQACQTDRLTKHANTVTEIFQLGVLTQLNSCYYSIVGGLRPASIDALRQVGHSVRLGILAKPRACFGLNSHLNIPVSLSLSLVLKGLCTSTLSCYHLSLLFPGTRLSPGLRCHAEATL